LAVGIDALADSGGVPSIPSSAIVGLAPSSVNLGSASWGTRHEFLGRPAPASAAAGGAGPGCEALRGLLP
jgi:hypothetical protein